MSTSSSDFVTIVVFPKAGLASGGSPYGELSAVGATEKEATRNLNLAVLRREEAEGLVILPARYREGSTRSARRRASSAMTRCSKRGWRDGREPASEDARDDESRMSMSWIRTFLAYTTPGIPGSLPGLRPS